MKMCDKLSTSPQYISITLTVVFGKEKIIDVLFFITLSLSSIGNCSTSANVGELMGFYGQNRVKTKDGKICTYCCCIRCAQTIL